MKKKFQMPDDKAQSKRFIEDAKALGADQNGERFEKALHALTPPHATYPSPTIKDTSRKKSSVSKK